MFTAADVAEVRHVVQRILVPCVFVIGLLGNSVSIYVLTRKRMRCTTNIYLTALAITDIFYLTAQLLLSLKHYDYVQQHVEPYWLYYGIMVWLCDAGAYISIYIAVCFTIERFIAIRYPLRRQTFCTESLAKKVIAGVALFCLLSTLSTAFEHQYGIRSKLIDGQGLSCTPTAANPLEMERNSSAAAQYDDAATQEDDGSGGGPFEATFMAEADDAFLTSVRERTMKAGAGSSWGGVASANIPIPNLVSEAFFFNNNNNYDDTDLLLDAAVVAGADTYQASSSERNGQTEAAAPPLLPELPVQLQMKSKRHAAPDGSSVAFNVTAYCQNVTYYQNTASSLGENALYIRLWSVFTLFVFVLIPLCVLGTFNCFLIVLVRRSTSLRGKMTNASSMRRPKHRRGQSSVSQENRVTITLIAVVLLFIVCQLPWAIYLIVSEHMNIEPHTQAIAGNICNFLVALNAAANFFLYCVLSDKYRKTVRELITGYRYKSGQRNTLTSGCGSVYTHQSQRQPTTTTANGSRRSPYSRTATTPTSTPSAATSLVIK